MNYYVYLEKYNKFNDQYEKDEDSCKEIETLEFAEHYAASLSDEKDELDRVIIEKYNNYDYVGQWVHGMRGNL